MTAQMVKETELNCLVTMPSGKVNETMINNAENQLLLSLERRPQLLVSILVHRAESYIFLDSKSQQARS